MAGERAQSNPGDGNDCDVAVATLTAGAPAGSSTTPVRVIPISSDPVTRLPVVRHVTPAYNRYSIVNRCFLVHSASAQAPLSYAGPFRMQASSLGQYFAAGGIGPLRLGGTTQALLYAAGQPAARPGPTYRYCVGGARGAVAAVFDGGGRVAMVASSAPGYRAAGVAPGTRVRALRRRARRAVGNVWLGRRLQGGARFAYVVRRGRVATLAVVSGPATQRAALAADVRAAGL